MTATLVATPDPDDGPSKTVDPEWEEFVEAHSPDDEYDLVELFKYRRRHYWDELEKELSPEFVEEFHDALDKMSGVGQDYDTVICDRGIRERKISWS